MYTPLYVKTNYSLLSSLVTIDNLISLCKKHNLKSIAICDDDMTSTMVFYKECKKNNIKPVIGLDVKLDDLSVLLYAKDYEGYQNLIKLSTKKYERNIYIDDLKERKDNLICVLPFESRVKFEELKDIYEEIYLGYQNKNEEEEVRKYTQDIVFLNKVLYLNKDEATYLKYIFMIRDGKTISDDTYYKENDNCFILPEEVINLSNNLGLNNTNHIIDSCNFEFKESTNLLPIYKVESGNSFEYLKNLSIKGLSKRLGNDIPEKYKERLIYELNIINDMGFSNYFLVVYDFIKYAKKNGILVGPGRGSAGGSLVAYSLGITDIDPIYYDLLFERFLNPERVTMPDIDTDFPDIYRDQVIKYVTDKYGEKNVSGIVTFGTLGAKQVIRDVGRVLNADTSDIDFLCKRIPTVTKQKLNDFYNTDREFKNLIDSDNKLKLLYRICNIIEGFPRHTSMHAAGIVMSEKPLDEVIPLVKNNDIYLSGFTMEHLEELGLLKMDFLGLKNLTTIMNVIDDIEKGEGIKIDFSSIPFEDEDAIKLFQTADTSGIFQFESDGMRNFLRKLKPSNLDDIIAAIALFRPGPAVNIDSYIRRKHGQEEIEYLHEDLKPILSSTYGIIIYQEQIMQIVSVMAGFSFGEADILRRAMSKKKKEILKSEEEKFLEGCKNKGYSEEISKKVYDLILNFANYGFNKSHSVAYSIIAYRMAYLKAKYPKYFFSNLLSSVIGSESKTKEYIDEARRLNIKILNPNINKSMNYYTVEKEGIRFPLSNIKNVGTVTCHDILSKRDNYKDIYDCISKIVSKNVNKKVLEALIDSSCFADFGYNIKTLNDNLDNLINYANLAKDLDESLILKPEIEIKEEYSKEMLMEREKELFGFYLSNYPTTSYKAKFKVINLNEIERYFNKNIDVIVLVDRIKEITTKKSEKMAFITGSDETDTLDLTLFPSIYSKYQVKRGDILLVRGKVERRMDKYQLVVDKIRVLYE
ncbi:MAG: DNA polymerase III subunit alpha [Firmicutes bacterium]|nr:DNA polymerase III subunit alpha [Bacillota bacterium]